MNPAIQYTCTLYVVVVGGGDSLQILRMPPAPRYRISRKAAVAAPETATTTSTAPEPGQLHAGESKALKRARMLTHQLDSASTNAQLPSDANLSPPPQPVATVLPISTQPSFQPILSTTPSSQPFTVKPLAGVGQLRGSVCNRIFVDLSIGVPNIVRKRVT